MKEFLKHLLELQSLDTEIIFLTELRKKRPLELEKERFIIDHAKAGLDNLLQDIKRHKMEVDMAELDLKKDQAELEKVQVALNVAKSNQEYQVLKDQIARLKEKMGKTEEVVLGKLTDIDQLVESKKGAQEKLEKAQKEFAGKEVEMHKFVKELDDRAGGLEGKRGDKSSGVPQEALQVYSRVLARYRDGALAMVQNHVCQGCHMAVTNQLITHLMLGRDLVQCKNCMRILYLPD